MAAINECGEAHTRNGNGNGNGNHRSRSRSKRVGRRARLICQRRNTATSIVATTTTTITTTTTSSWTLLWIVSLLSMAWQDLMGCGSIRGGCSPPPPFLMGLLLSPLVVSAQPQQQQQQQQPQQEEETSTNIIMSTTIRSAGGPEMMKQKTTTTTPHHKITKIAFGSCHKNYKATVPSVWDTLLAQEHHRVSGGGGGGGGDDDNDDDDNDDDKDDENDNDDTIVVTPGLDAFVWTGDAMYPSHRDPITGKKQYGPTSLDDLRKAFDEMKVNTTIGYTHLLSSSSPSSSSSSSNEAPTTPIQVYGTWDDHDYGGNDMGEGMPHRRARQQIFWDFLGYNGAHARRHRHRHRHRHRRRHANSSGKTDDQDGDDDDDDELDDGMYHTVDITSQEEKEAHHPHEQNDVVKLILLDTRWFRQDHCIPSVGHLVPMGNAISCATRWLTSGLNLWRYAWLWGKEGCEQATILGETQWEWLEKELLSSTADLNIIVSSVQIFSTNPAMESWGQFPKEQERMWTLLGRHYSNKTSQGTAGPVIFLSGDVHHGEIIGQEGYLEVTSSGMTHHCGQPKLYGRLCQPILEHFQEHRHSPDAFYIGLNYGLLTVNWETRVATVQVKDATSGATVLQVEQSLDAPIELPSYQSLPRTWNGHLLPWLRRIIVAMVFAFSIARRILRSRTSTR